MTKVEMYELFVERFLQTKEQYNKMVANEHPDAFLTKHTMETNERLMNLIKTLLS